MMLQRHNRQYPQETPCLQLVKWLHLRPTRVAEQDLLGLLLQVSYLHVGLCDAGMVVV